MVAIATYPGGQRAIVDTARRLLDLKLHSTSKHGNLSVRVPGRLAMLLSSVSTLDLMTADTMALVGLDGRVLEGELEPVVAEIVEIHTIVYQLRSDVGAVIHTHAPYVTAFALAGRPIGPVYEGLVRWDVTEPVPVAAYGPRGSRTLIENVARAIEGTPGCKAVLLANHGVLVFDRNLSSAVRVHVGLEEAAQFSLLAAAIGGPRELTLAPARAAQLRRDEFARGG